MKAPLIYIAGPFRADTAWAVECNVRMVERLGLAVAKCGGVPMIPHTMYRFFDGTLTEEFWLDATQQILNVCQAVVVVRDWAFSAGTIDEVLHAESTLDIPLFFAGETPPANRQSIKDLSAWIDNWKELHK